MGTKICYSLRVIEEFRQLVKQSTLLYGFRSEGDFVVHCVRNFLEGKTKKDNSKKKVDDYYG